MGRFSLIILALGLLTGCATMTTARYSMSADNNVALKKYTGSEVFLQSLAPPPNFNADCRMVGPITAADGKSIPEFVRNAFNDEFKFANIYSKNGVELHGSLTRLAFSSSSGLTNGWWKIGIKLTSSNGKSMSESSETDFKSGFVGLTACNNTAQALNGAVQDLIHKVVTDPRFGTLLKE